MKQTLLSALHVTPPAPLAQVLRAMNALPVQDRPVLSHQLLLLLLPAPALIQHTLVMALQNALPAI